MKRTRHRTVGQADGTHTKPCKNGFGSLFVTTKKAGNFLSKLPAF